MNRIHTLALASAFALFAPTAFAQDATPPAPPPAVAVAVSAPVVAEPAPLATRPPAKEGWKKLGERVVQGKKDVDVIKASSKGKFTHIAFFVQKEEIAVTDVEIEFADGQKWSPTVRLLFKDGSRSRVIDLPGGERTIKKITFKYGNLDAKKKAQVEIWGKK